MRRTALFLPLLLAACGGDDPSLAALEAKRLGLVPELRVGSVDDPETSLTWFRALEIGRDGRIYTLHPMEQRIRVHDATGRPLAPIGREGEGPGEFKSPGAMGWRSDTLWVLDFGTYRFNFFDADGRFLRSQAIPVDLGRSMEDRPPRPNGLVHDGSIQASPPAWSRLVADGSIAENLILRMDTTGQVLDTIARYPLANTTLEIADPESPNGFAMYTQQPFSDAELVRISPTAAEVVRVDRSVADGATPANFRVTKLTFAGDTLFSRTFAYEPKPLKSALVDSIVRGIGERFKGTPRPGAPTPAMAEALARKAIYMPAFHPPVTELLVGRDGSLWLKREHTGGEAGDWLVLSPEGEPLGVVAVPDRLRVLAADRERVWGMEMDDLDVPYLVRYAVRPLAEDYGGPGL